jgi:hypothetical protein
MRPTPFSIEIPDRPVYQPGSGPPMAPITLQPDDSDTGWIIADTIDFQGVSQYVVTRRDNPAHRRPVKKQHILDWVSPKAYEDYEYEQYNIQVQAGKEKEMRILAKAAAVRERIRRLGLAKDRAKVKKPFARYMQIEQVDDSDRGRLSMQLSSLKHSTDELSSGMLPQNSKPGKRKRSVGFPHWKEPAVKRRGLSSVSKASLVWKAGKPPPLQSSNQRQFDATEDETDMEDETETSQKHNVAEIKRLDTLDHPSLQAQRRPPISPRAAMPGKPSMLPYSAPSLFSPVATSPSRLSPKLPRSVPGPPIHASSNYARSAASQPQLKPMFPNKKNKFQYSNNGESNSQILAATKIWKPSASRLIYNTSHVKANGLGKSSKRGSPNPKKHSLSPRDESTVAEEENEANSKCENIGLEPYNEKELMGRSHLSDQASRRGARAREHVLLNRRRDKGSRPSSSGSSNKLRWPTPYRGSMVSGEQSKYFASMKMKQNGEEDFDVVQETGDDERKSEESWDIHGILDDEMRRVNGQLVRHYLCEWAGDWDPTWEPEQNVSTDAIRKYEKKKKRDSFGFGGAADMGTVSESDESRDRKILQRLDDIRVLENGTSDSEAFTAYRGRHVPGSR